MEEKEEKIQPINKSGDNHLTSGSDYGDLHIAVDFGTTATTCVFGRTESGGISSGRAYLVSDRKPSF